MEYERIPTDNPIRAIWDRYGLLASLSGAKIYLKRKTEKAKILLKDELLDKKAQGIAFCIRSANDYFRASIDGSLTSASLASYYGTFNLLQSLLLAEINNEITLTEIEKYTSFGHGLGSISDTSKQFPESEYLFILKDGLFPRYLRQFGLIINELAVSKKYQVINDVENEDKCKLIKVKDLLSRIPELKSMYLEIYREHPNYLTYLYPNNPEIKEYEIKFYIDMNSPYLTEKQIYEILGWSQDIKIERTKDKNVLNGDTFRSIDKINREIVDKLKMYESVMASDCFIKPLLNIDDILCFDFMLLYLLSIWVRYRPQLWREIVEGKYDMYKPLLSNFLVVAQRVIPNIVLERLYNRRMEFK
jgi:hypothetical protein